jgi:hypothetical protein
LIAVNPIVYIFVLASIAQEVWGATFRNDMKGVIDVLVEESSI